MRRPLRVRDMCMSSILAAAAAAAAAAPCMRAVGGGTVLQCIFGSRTAPCVL
jgi:hypothetical protein